MSVKYVISDSGLKAGKGILKPIRFFAQAGGCIVNACGKKVCAFTVILGFSFLCCCTASRMETKTEPLPAESAIRLPYGTAPMVIEQATPPPPGSVQSTMPTEAQEGMARSLRLFQINLGQTKTGPAPTKETPGLPEAEP